MVFVFHLTLYLFQPCIRFNNKFRLKLRFKKTIDNLEVVQPHCKNIPYLMVRLGGGYYGVVHLIPIYALLKTA